LAFLHSAVAPLDLTMIRGLPFNPAAESFIASEVFHANDPAS
jgi:hypothetical protein